MKKFNMIARYRDNGILCEYCGFIEAFDLKEAKREFEKQAVSSTGFSMLKVIER